MANKNPSKRTRFKKGQSGNPLGGKLHDPEIRAIKKLTKEQLKEVGSLLLNYKLKELKALARSKEATIMQQMIASLAFRIIVKGDPVAFDKLLDRLIGKVKEEIEHSGTAAQHVVRLYLPPGREKLGSGGD